MLGFQLSHYQDRLIQLLLKNLFRRIRMVKNDIDQLQSFGAKIKQQNKSISASKHQNSMQQKIPLSKRLINFFKNLVDG